MMSTSQSHFSDDKEVDFGVGVGDEVVVVVVVGLETAVGEIQHDTMTGQDSLHGI